MDVGREIFYVGEPYLLGIKGSSDGQSSHLESGRSESHLQYQKSNALKRYTIKE